MSSKVSVICIAYNHEPFIEAALQSVFNQTYNNLELIVLDDGSNDGSVQLIKRIIEGKDIPTVFHDKNEGYTKTFNQGFSMSSGDFIIDFALDDVMKPDFVAKSIAKFEASSERTGVVFSNADYIDKDSVVIDNHNDRLFRKGMIKAIPSGDVFEWVLKRYFICTPTMVIKREVLDRLGAYDESLAYEDFDFWVRSSRYWEYTYLDEVLFQKRKLKNSMSGQRHRFHFNEQMNSAFKVCEKAFHLVKTKKERMALIERLNYEYRQCLRTDNDSLAKKYKLLTEEVGGRIHALSFFGKYLSRKP